MVCAFALRDCHVAETVFGTGHTLFHFMLSMAVGGLRPTVQLLKLRLRGETLSSLSSLTKS